ncbi:hypothetical protein JCM16138_13830 [Thermococcus atlanticus]
MGLFSFGSKRDKIRKLIEAERFDEVVSRAVKDKKSLEALVELLEDRMPGVRGDALLLLSNVARQNGYILKPHMEKIISRSIQLTRDGNPYVRENAMLLSYELIRMFPEDVERLKSDIVRTLIEELQGGDKNGKAFAMIVLGELKVKDAAPYVEELSGVEDKVILPFEGKKWVPLGEIAKETLERLR